MQRLYLTLGTLIILIIGGLEISQLANPDRSNQQTSLAQMTRIMELQHNPTAKQLKAWGVPLEPKEAKDQRHTHAAVRVYWNGAAWPIPKGFGVSADGKSLAMHTHTADGVVHFHLPTGYKPFTLRQILQVWGLPVRGQKIDGQPITVWKNGLVCRDGLDQAVPDKADLVIEIGKPSSKVPLRPFDWSTIPLRSSR